MENKNMIITIGREFGSGGHEIGKRIAEILGIHFYDKNLVHLAAEKSGLNTDVLDHSDEKAPGLIMSPYSNTISDQLFAANAAVIKSLADQESFVIVGRCANYILDDYADSLDVFIYAPLEDRIVRVKDRYLMTTADEAKKEIKKTDKNRKSYYQFYTDYNWGGRDGVDLMIDSSVLGIEGTAQLIAEVAQKKFGLSEEARLTQNSLR